MQVTGPLGLVPRQHPRFLPHTNTILVNQRMVSEQRSGVAVPWPSHLTWDLQISLCIYSTASSLRSVDLHPVKFQDGRHRPGVQTLEQAEGGKRKGARSVGWPTSVGV